MGTHPIFESDFDCLTEMRFSQVLARAARTEYRTPVMKHPYQPGSTFGFLSPATPAYLFAGGCIFATVVELAYQSHQIMEGAVARSSITRRSRLMERIEFVTAHPMLVLDYFVVWLHHIRP